MSDTKLEMIAWGVTSRRSKCLKTFGALAQVALGGILLIWIFGHTNLSTERIIQVIGQSAITPLMIAILCFSISMILKAFLYRVLLPSSIPYTYLTGVALTQNALLTFLPWRMGEISFPLLLNRDYGIPVASGVSAIILVRFVDLLIVTIIALFSIPKITLTIAWGDIALGSAIAAGLLAITAIASRIRSLNVWLKTFIVALEPLRGNRRIGRLFILSASVFILTTLQATFALRSMGLNITLTDAAILNAVTLVAAILPIHPPGGWGTVDSIQVTLLQRLNYEPELSAPVILATHGFYTLLVLAGGFVGWLIRGKTGRR